MKPQICYWGLVLLRISLVPHILAQQMSQLATLWGVGGKSCGSSLQEGVLHTYTLRLS